MGSQDIIDLKKGYLKHAACDGTRFELVVHYMTFYVATCQGLIGDCRLHPTFPGIHTPSVTQRVIEQLIAALKPFLAHCLRHHHHSPTLRRARSTALQSLLQCSPGNRNRTRWCSDRVGSYE